MKTKEVVSILHPQIKVVGGAMKQMILLADFLSSDKEVTFFSFSGSDKDLGKSNNFLFKNYYPNYPFKILSFLIIAYKIRNSNLIIAGNSPMHFVGVLSKILFRSKAKLIWWNHHYPWYYNKNIGFLTHFKKIIEKLIVKKIDIIVGNSYFLKDSLNKIYIDSNISILYPLVDTIYLNQKNKSEKNIKINQEKIIFTCSRWVKGKNIGLIFRLYQELQNKLNIKIIIGGEGEELKKYKKLYKGNTNIIFLGTLDKEAMLDNFNKSDLFLFPSKIDSFGMIALESLFCGVPVIGFNRGGLREIITENRNGFLVDDEKDFIEKTYLLLKDEDKIKYFKQNSRKMVVSNYGIENFKKQLSEVIFKK